MHQIDLVISDPVNNRIQSKENSVAQRVDTVVIGGGIVGWSAAYHLVRQGQRVAVVDRRDQGQATAAGAGIISPGSSVRMPKATIPLSKAAVTYYPFLIATLGDDGQLDTGFASPGTLFIFQNDEEMGRLPEVKAFAEGLKSDGFGCIGDITVLSGAEAKRAFPVLGDHPGALHLASGSRVDGRLMRDALRAASLLRGAIEIVGSATVRAQGDHADTVIVGGNTIAFDSLLIAGGAWTPELGATLHCALPVAPQRGQILHFEIDAVDTSDWTIIHGFHNHYLLAFPPHRVVAGATREDGSGFDYRETVGGVYQELGEALRVAPGLANATLAEIRVGFRPSSIDTLPIMGRLPQYRNVFVATGHGPSGLQLGPVSGMMVADELLGRPGSEFIQAYSPDRFDLR